MIRIGTRKSPLALAQSEETARKLGVECTIVGMSTTGDNITDRTLIDAGGKGLFTKELDEALLKGEVDIAVHSMKDMPTVLPDNICIGAVLEREDVRDVLITPHATSLADLPEASTFGTASLRRAAQILMIRPDLKIIPLRGNVQTRLRKIAEGEAMATLLAKAGLNRLGMEAPGAVLSLEEQLPAVAQGAICITYRTDNKAMAEILHALNHLATSQAVTCERAFLKVLDGSCRTPIAGYAQLHGQKLHFRGLLATPDGAKFQRIELEGAANAAESLGIEAGEELLRKWKTMVA